MHDDRLFDPHMPVLVGCGEITDSTTPASAGRSPYELIAQAARAALADAAASDTQALATCIDTVMLVRGFADTSHRFAHAFGTSANPPKSVADRLGLHATRHVYSGPGGNMPQVLVNQCCEAIAEGRMRAALICGGEALRTQHGLQRADQVANWAEDPGGTPELIGTLKRGWSDHEDRHGLRAAIAFYPLFENAWRAAKGLSLPEHLNGMAALMARFAAVAATNPLATRREAPDAERLARIDDGNRWIGFPYPRLMNANAFIDQSAALLLTSVGEARRLGIARERWVFLHGCAEGHDHWHVSDREHFHRAPALRAVAQQALAMAGRTLAEMDLIDLYSCFPSAVEIASDEVGLALDDPRGLTVTGGLPFFGGPGNNYVTHSIATMMRRLRALAAERGGPALGLVTANGNYLTKHAWGVYGTAPPPGPWRREPPARLQAELDTLPRAPFTEAPAGRATIETYTVLHGRDGPEAGFVFGRLADSGRRFLARLPDDPARLGALQAREAVGWPGSVRTAPDGLNRFLPDAP